MRRHEVRITPCPAPRDLNVNRYGGLAYPADPVGPMRSARRRGVLLAVRTPCPEHGPTMPTEASQYVYGRGPDLTGTAGFATSIDRPQQPHHDPRNVVAHT
jgi:hypothetical protein